MSVNRSAYNFTGSELFQLYFEPYQGLFQDDTAVNGMEAKCLGPGMEGNVVHIIEQKFSWEHSRWSTWSSECPSGSAVCAIKTRVEEPQSAPWAVDNGGLTSARLLCCEY